MLQDKHPPKIETELVVVYMKLSSRSEAGTCFWSVLIRSCLLLLLLLLFLLLVVSILLLLGIEKPSATSSWPSYCMQMPRFMHIWLLWLDGSVSCLEFSPGLPAPEYTVVLLCVNKNRLFDCITMQRNPLLLHSHQLQLDPRIWMWKIRLMCKDASVVMILIWVKPMRHGLWVDGVCIYRFTWSWRNRLSGLGSWKFLLLLAFIVIRELMHWRSHDSWDCPKYKS